MTRLILTAAALLALTACATTTATDYPRTELTNARPTLWSALGSVLLAPIDSPVPAR